MSVLRALGCGLVLMVSGVQVAEPVFDAIDYASPEKYLEIAPSLGDREAITKLAGQLRKDSDLATVRSILKWFRSDLEYDANKAYEWRNFDRVMNERCYASCADQAIVVGALLKGAGIPAVWVKTMDVPWIWSFKSGRPFESWSGHVFLEIDLDGNWVLLDPGAATIYQNYSPSARLLPGNRFAYHKGNDPFEMVMSLQWEEWKQQTEKYFNGLDPSLLPVDPAAARLLTGAFIVGNSPHYQRLTSLIQRLGQPVRLSFNCEYDTHLPAAEGSQLLVETHGDKPILPLEVLERHYPGVSAGLRSPDRSVTVKETSILFLDVEKSEAAQEEAVREFLK